MRETSAQTIVTHYFTAKPQTCLYEVKVARAGKFRFSQLEEQQIAALYNCKHKGLHYKMSDESRGHKPSDGFCMSGEDAWVIVFYPEAFVFLDIDIVIQNKKEAMDFSTASFLSDKIVKY